MTRRILIRILYVTAGLCFLGVILAGCFGERIPEGDKTEAGLHPAPGSLVSKAAFSRRLLRRLPIADRSGSLLVVSRSKPDGTSERYHPYGALARPLLGYLDEYARGLDGIEYAYDNVLLGKAEGERSSIQNPFTLTIDRKIQAQSEKNLAWQMKRLKAVRGSQIIMDLASGQIIAMASLSTSQDGRAQGPFENLALQDGVDPWALVVNLAWLDKQQEYLLASRDSNGHQRKTSQADAKPDRSKTSSWHWQGVGNRGKLWTRFQDDSLLNLHVDTALLRQLVSLGFGQPTGIDLPGEKQGALPVSLADNVTTIIDSGMNASPLQLLCAFSAMIRGGIPVHPFTGLEHEPTPPAKVNGPTFDKKVLQAFIQEIGDNHGPSIASVTQKTGRARYEILGMGFWPADSPKISYITVLDDARIDASRRRGTLGRTARIARRAAQLPHRQILAGTSTGGRGRDMNSVPWNGNCGKKAGPWIMPDLRGRSLRSALDAVSGFGLRLRVKGAGTVKNQSPMPGTKIKRGICCTIVCST